MANSVEQKVTLDYKGYTDGAKAIADTQKRTSSDVDKSLQGQNRAWQASEKQVKFSVASISRELKGLGKEMLSNTGKGLLIGGGALAANGAKNAIGESAKAMLAFGEAMSRVKLKVGGSKKEIDDLQDSLAELSRTGASLSSIPDAFDEIFSATGDIGKSKGVLSQVSKFASGTDSKDASRVAEFVRKNLTSQNKEVNTGNTGQLLDSVASMVKSGSFKTLDDAMGSFGGVDANAMATSHISNKTVAGMLSAGSSIGEKNQSTAAISELVKGSANGFAGNAVLQGIMGTSSLFKNGNFDPAALGKASKNFKSKGYSDAGFKQLLGQSGMSEDASNGLVNILKNGDKFVAGIKKFDEGATSASKVVDEMNDNISGKLHRVLGGLSSSFLELLNHVKGGEPGKIGGDLTNHGGDLALGTGVALGGAAATGLAFKSLGSVFSGGKVASGVLGEAAAGDAAIAGGTAAVGGASATGGSVLSGALGMGVGGTILSLIGPLIAAAIAKAFGDYFASLGSDPIGAAASDIADVIREALGTSQHKVKVEVFSQDPGFSAKPKQGDLPKSIR
jgi:prefoldin subunit 5